MGFVRTYCISPNKILIQSLEMKVVMAQVIKYPEKMGISQIKRYAKVLNDMNHPGVPVFQEVLSVISICSV